jgi:hypothetical protein
MKEKKNWNFEARLGFGIMGKKRLFQGKGKDTNYHFSNAFMIKFERKKTALWFSIKKKMFILLWEKTNLFIREVRYFSCYRQNYEENPFK